MIKINKKLAAISFLTLSQLSTASANVTSSYDIIIKNSTHSHASCENKFRHKSLESGSYMIYDVTIWGDGSGPGTFVCTNDAGKECAFSYHAYSKDNSAVSTSGHATCTVSKDGTVFIMK